MSPRTLRLRPGISRVGKIKILRRESDGRYLVDWEAHARNDKNYWILDRCVATREEIASWTGVVLEAGDG